MRRKFFFDINLIPPMAANGTLNGGKQYQMGEDGEKEEKLIANGNKQLQMVTSGRLWL